MRRKRLQHAAHIFCHMFCGWRLINSYAQLEDLGCGNLEIDVITEKCTFDGRGIQAPPIASELAAWFRRDLHDHSINLDDIISARLSATLGLRETPWSKRARGGAQFFTSSGEQFKADTAVRCDISCEAQIHTSDAEYSASLTHIEQWPKGFGRPN